MNINRCLLIVAVAIVGMLAAVSTTAQDGPNPPGIIYNSIGFQHFTVGETLVDQDGWAANAPILSPNAAVVSKDPRQSIRVRGADLEHSDFVRSHSDYDAIGSYGRRLTDCVRCQKDGDNAGYDAIANGTPVVQIQADVRLEGPQTRNRDLFSASITSRGVSQALDDVIELGELEIDADGHVYGYTGTDPTGEELPLVSVLVEPGAWHHLAIELNFAARTYAFSVDGRLIAAPFLFPLEADTSVLRRGSMVTYARPDAGTFHRSNYVVHFDNFSVAAQ